MAYPWKNNLTLRSLQQFQMKKKILQTLQAQYFLLWKSLIKVLYI